MRAGEIAVARREGVVVGCVRVRRLDDQCGGLGMLAADPTRPGPTQHGTGLGRALLDFAEELSASRGLRTMQLELLAPREWTHPSKAFLADWYTRRGYRLTRTDRPEDTIPHLTQFLVTECDYRVYHKALTASTSRTGQQHLDRRHVSR